MSVVLAAIRGSDRELRQIYIVLAEDDTLFPTRHVTEVVKAVHTKAEQQHF